MRLTLHKKCRECESKTDVDPKTYLCEKCAFEQYRRNKASYLNHLKRMPIEKRMELVEELLYTINHTLQNK